MRERQFMPLRGVSRLRPDRSNGRHVPERVPCKFALDWGNPVAAALFAVTDLAVVLIDARSLARTATGRRHRTPYAQLRARRIR